ncbi:MAG: acetyl-CoA carboxylase biotin carboxyl carrier protein [Hyphomicrobiales bacterium]|nr:acetyl-CoA carboxylase biotin carboxyl carrier protein [Hyphomicrobiales bacterium]MBV8426702.1 acetyl-CoA carboxylase biotin carboxyl carrier protein [Hyphomicrobiales bacterium]MBV8763652.1 acetyl-CoA carboxylase biotin carboxyl carrier protein [Hyphomicrobiales bacterium]MBV9741156.1 acetyl-CoA carboxylase biotin carboxyl carrier protein [Hyphomicrobiales bacterium]MBW0003278.1 acetyl-CoA carboxylase biotin carboxyl carrier protein [Hyphomicrobiales bacterium]
MRKSNPFDTENVRQLANLLAETDLTEIEVQKGDLRVRVVRNVALPVAAFQAAATVPAVAAPEGSSAPSSSPPAPQNDGRKENTVTSPMVGTAYRRPAPEARPFVEIGSAVKEGERILLIEAMKTFNEITAPRSGTVSEILVEDGQPVEFGEPLMVIE